MAHVVSRTNTPFEPRPGVANQPRIISLYERVRKLLEEEPVVEERVVIRPSAPPSKSLAETIAIKEGMIPLIPQAKLFSAHEQLQAAYKKWKAVQDPNKLFFGCVPTELDRTEASKFCFRSFGILDNEMQLNKYNAYEKQLETLFECAFARIAKLSTLPRPRDAFTEIKGHIAGALDDDDGPYAHLKYFQSWLHKIGPLKEFLKYPLLEKESDFASKVKFPDLFSDVPVVVKKSSRSWEAECALIENFYLQYSQMLNDRVDRWNRLLQDYHSLYDTLIAIERSI